MKNVKGIFSLIVLIVLIGTEILTPISYAFDDVENNPDSTQSYVDDGDRFEVDSNLVVESEEQQFQPEENDEGVEEINVPDSVELVEKQGGDLYDEFEEGGDDAQNSFIEPEESYGDDVLNVEISTQNMADSKSDDELVSNEIEYPSEFLLDDSDDEKELIDIIKDMVDDAVPEAYIGLNQVELTGSAFYDGVTVNVVAPKRSFPEGTQLRISTIEEDEEIKEKENQLIQQVEEVTEKSKKVSFDITFYNPEEPEIELQPIEGQVVSVVFDYQNNKSFRKADEEENNLKLKVYHLEESEENEGEVVAQEVKQKREADGLEISIENSSDENVGDEENGKEEKSEYEILANEFSVYVLTVVENDQVEVFLDANGGELVENEDVTILDECDEPGMLCATIISQEGYIVLPDAFRENATFLGWIGGDLEQVMAGYSVQTSQADGNTYRAKYTCNHGYIENEGECVSMDLSDRGISYDAEAGTITVWGGGLKYTILDKNVGATHTGYGVTDADAWGAYFQWGNNYPFYWSDVADIKVGAVTTRYSLQSTEIPNYSSSTWIKSNPWFSNILRNSAFGPDNLWGGVSDEGDRNSRQGPCPDGYHVPSESELSNLYIARKAYHNNEENTNGNLMIQDLYIPYQGGMVGNTLASSNFNTTAYLWTNSRGDNDNSRRFVIGASSISVNNASRYHGSPVRCFQNYDTSSNKVVTYVYEQLVQFKKDSCIHTDLSMFTEENKWKDFQISFGMDQGSLISRNSSDTFISSSHEVSPYPGFVFRYRSNNVSDFDFYNGSTNSHIYTSVSSANVVNIFRQGKYLIFNNNVVSDNIYGTNLFSEPITIGCSLAGNGIEQRHVQGILSDVKIRVVYDLDDVILPSPTKTNREFGGWYTTPDFQEGTKVGSTQGIGDAILYARWLCDNGDDELDSCGKVDDIADKTITFDANGGTFENGESTKLQMVSYGAIIGDVENPTKDGDEFLGWMQNGSSTYFDLEGTVVYGDTTLYAVWKNSDAYIQVGQNFNDSIKSLVNWKLNNISSFERADTMSDEIKNSSNTILISLVDSAPIYAWYDSSDGTVYYYSDSETIYLKGSAANMFKGWTNVRYIDTRGWNTSGVTNMSYMFNGCSSLTELDVSDFDTANVINMSYMFNGCSSLTELDVSDFDTVNVTNMSYMFNGCSSLTELDVSGFDTVNVTNMSYMFYGCGNLTELDVSDFTTSKVINMQAMFQGCSSLTELDVSNFNTSKVTYMDYMFYGCSSLVELDLSNFNTSKVTSMQAMFQGCSDLTELDLSNFDTSNVGNMSYMFSGCSSLTELDVSNFNTSKVTNMSYMFQWCGDLESLDVTSFATPNVTNMMHMFEGCSSLTELDVSNFDTSKVNELSWIFHDCKNLTDLDLRTWNVSSVVYMGSMFQGCSNLKNIDVSTWETTRVVNIDNMFNGCSSLTELDLSNFDTSNVKLMNDMFNGCSSLTELDLSNFNTTNVTTMSYMFNGCSSLTELDLSNFDTSKVTTMGGMLNGCSGLIELNLSGWNFSKYGSKNLMSNLANGSMISLKKLDMTNTKHGTSMEGTFKGLGNVREIVLEGVDTTNVTTMSYMFQGCSSLEKMDLSNFDTSKVTTMSYMFNGCSSLTELDLSNFNTTNVTTMSYMFNGCSSLTELDLSNFDTSKVTAMGSMLNGCSGLIELNLSGWNFSKYGSKNLMSNLANGSMISLKKLDMTNTKHGTSMEGTFKGLGNVREIVLEGVDTTNVTTMTLMFRGCSSLEKLDLSGFDTSKVTTMSYMFNGCSSLTGLDLSNFNTSNVTNMANMFDGCSSLSTIYASSNFVTTKVTTSSDMFKGVTQIVGGNGTTYKSNKVDKTYAKIDNAPEILGYFTDPTSFEIRFCDLNENEVAIQRIGVGEYVAELSGGDFKYYTSPDMSESFDFDIPQYKYTKVYVNSIYKVNYDSTTNGGTTQLQQELVENGNNATLGLYTGYKDGWTFLGWNTDQDATESLESLEVTGNITVYAIYKKEAITLTGNFGLNGGGIGFVGEGETSCVLPAVYNKGVQDTTCNIYSPEIFIPEGSDRVFLGLNSDPSLTGNAGNVIYNNETHVSTVVLTQSTSGRTWYIISKYPAITMNVIFDMNGSDGMNLQDSCTIPEVYNTVQQDTLCSVVAPEVTTSTNTPNFVGWNSISDATENNSDYNIQDGTLVLKLGNGTTQRWYAITKSDVIKRYIVYHVNGNSWNDGSVGNLKDEVCQISPSYNGNPQESSCTNDSYLVQTFKANGTKTPLGWSVLNATGSDILYQGGQTVSLSLDQNLDLYAQSVVKGQEYSVLFSGNGAKLGNEKEDEISLMCKGLDSYNGEDESKSRKCKLVTPDIIREGYTILGYSQSPESMDKEGDYMQMGTEIEVSVNGAVMYPVTYRTLTTIFNKNGNLAQKNSGSSDSVTWNITKLCDIWNTHTECDIITPKIVPAVDKVVMGYSTSSTVYQNSVPEESSLSVSDSDIYYAWSQSSPGIKTAIYTIGVGIEEQNLPDVQCVPDIQYNGDEIVDECEVSLPQVTAKIGYGTPKWYIGNNEVSVDETMRVKINQDTQFIVKAEPNTNTKYEINHRWQNVDDNEYSLHETVSMYGTTDTQTSAQPKSYDGFYYTGDIEQKNISGDGSTVIDIYYIRESYHLHVEDRDEVLVDTNMKFGENIPLLSDPSRAGYTFMGWDPEIPETMPAKNLTIVSKWVVNKYTITFDTDGGSGIDPIVEDYGTIIHVPNQPTKDGNHFLRWEPEIPETMPDQDLIIKAIWEEDRGNNYSGGGGGGDSEKYDEKDQHHSVGEWGDPIIYNKYNVVKKDSVVNKEMVMNQGKVSEDMLSVYEWARKNSITTKNTIETANPNGFVRRGHLAKMIVNYMINVQGKHIPYDVPYQCLHWNDDESLWDSDEIKDYATKACALGIMGVNMKNNQFKPNDVVSRAEFGTVLSRVLWGEKYNVSKASKDTPYYILHLSALKTEGIMMQIDNPMNVRELRKWIWLMLSRSSKIYKG